MEEMDGGARKDDCLVNVVSCVSAELLNVAGEVVSPDRDVFEGGRALMVACSKSL